MAKIVIFDTDGMVVHREMYFSKRFSGEFGVPMEKLLPFFKNEFQLCLVGKADLKEELAKYLAEWNWHGTVDELLVYWFTHESRVDEEMLESVKALKIKGVQCYLNTNNEKYRVQYLFEDLKLKDFFDGVFSSAELGYLKPQPEFWSAMYDRLGKPNKKDVLVWDDDEENVASATQFGFQAEFYSNFDSYDARTETFLTS